MDTELLIFSLISLIILIPIIYFLPLQLTKKGKLTVVAVTFLIALAGLMTRVFMQLWQTILLLVGLILLLSLILTKKFSPVLFSMSDRASNKEDEKGNEHDGYDNERHVFDSVKPQILPVMPLHDRRENLSVESERQEKSVATVSSDAGKGLNELEELQILEQEEKMVQEFIYAGEEAIINTPSVKNSMTGNEDISSLNDSILEEIKEPETIELGEQLNIPETENTSFLGELEELMFESQAEATASVESVDEQEHEDGRVTVQETEQQLDDIADLEAMLNHQLEDEAAVTAETLEEPAEESEPVVVLPETKKQPDEELNLFSALNSRLNRVEKSISVNEDLEEPAVELEQEEQRGAEQIIDADTSVEELLNHQFKEETEIEEYTVFHELPDEDLQVITHEQPEDAEIKNEKHGAISTVAEIQTADQDEPNEGNLYYQENTIDEENHNVLPFVEKWEQMEPLADSQNVPVETEILMDEQPIHHTESKQESGHEEVFETLLLQAEIAKKMHDEKQLKQIIEKFLNFEDVNDERYKRLQSLLKGYIDIIK